MSTDDATTRRQLAGDARAKAALEHLRAARDMLNAACRDLCSVAGAVPRYRDLGKLSRGVDDVIREIDLDYARCAGAHPYKLAHDPADDEIDHPHQFGCGLVPPLGVVSTCRPEAPFPSKEKR